MIFTLEDHEEHFVPKVLTVVLESPEEVGDFLKAVAHLPNYKGDKDSKERSSKYADLYDALEKIYSRCPD